LKVAAVGVAQQERQGLADGEPPAHRPDAPRGERRIGDPDADARLSTERDDGIAEAAAGQVELLRPRRMGGGGGEQQAGKE